MDVGVPMEEEEEEEAAHVNGGDQTAHGNHVLDETIFDSSQESSSSEEFA